MLCKVVDNILQEKCFNSKLGCWGSHIQENMSRNNVSSFAHVGNNVSWFVDFRESMARKQCFLVCEPSGKYGQESMFPGLWTFDKHGQETIVSHELRVRRQNGRHKDNLQSIVYNVSGRFVSIMPPLFACTRTIQIQPRAGRDQNGFQQQYRNSRAEKKNFAIIKYDNLHSLGLVICMK